MNSSTRSIFYISTQVSFSWHHRPLLGGNFNQLVSFKNIDICQIMKMTVGNPVVSPFLEFILTTAPGLIHECPYGPGIIKLENITFNPDKNPGIQKFKELVKLPSGEYQVKVNTKSPNDENVISVTIFYIINSREQIVSGDLRF